MSRPLPPRPASDADFAMLGGAAPIPASSGQTVRVRLNRSGDRQRNQALYVIVVTRLRSDPATRAYAQRRRALGRTNREIRRCLVGYVARQLFRLLETGPTPDAASECQGTASRASKARTGGPSSWESVAPPGRTRTRSLLLEEVSAPSGQTCRVRFPQARSGVESGQAGGVRSGCGRWNDRQNDRCGSARPPGPCECCYNHPCCLAQRSKTAEMAIIAANTTAKWGKSVRSFTMMFIP
jgi:Transposase IS116/IS110/IS902 family